MYLEALLSLIGRARWGNDFYDKEIDRRFTYEGKLKLLGIVDQSDMDSCTRFRESRKDLVHEKALDFGELKPKKKQKKQIPKKNKVAQDEAVFGVQFVKSMASKLQPAPDS